MKIIHEMRWWNALSVTGALSAFGFTLWLTAKRYPDVFPLPDKYFRHTGEVLIAAGLAFGAMYVFARLCKYVSEKLHEADRVGRENERLKEALRCLDLRGAEAQVARAKALWGATTNIDPPACTYEDDPVFLQIAVDSSLRKVLSQPIVQRLSHIRQLSFAYLTFGSATHTRLAHSLGACRNAELVMRRVFQENRLYTHHGVKDIELSEGERKTLVKLARLGALLHDLGHGPLSHALETHLGVDMKAKKPSKPDKELSIKYIEKYLSGILRDEDVNPDELIGLMEDSRLDLKPWMHFIADLIDSPLDVDRMDYLVRDAHMTGLSIGGLNIQALIERAVPFEEKDDTTRIELAFDSSALPYIEQFLYARDVMYLNCYEHHKKVCAESMLGRAYQDLKLSVTNSPEVNPEGLAFMTDHEFLQLVLECTGASTSSFKLVEMLMRGVTFRLLKEVPVKINLGDPNKPDGIAFEELPTKIKDWANAVMDGDYGLAYLETPERWAKDLARRSGVDPSRILVAVPSLSIVDKWAKEGEIRLLRKETNGGYAVSYVKDLPDTIWKDFVGALARARLKIRVFVDPELSNGDWEVVRERCGTFFSG